MAAARQHPLWPSIIAAAALSCLLTVTLLRTHPFAARPALLLGTAQLPRSAVPGAGDPLLRYGTGTQTAMQVTVTERWPQNVQHGVGAAFTDQLSDLTAAALAAGSGGQEQQQAHHLGQHPGRRMDQQQHSKLRRRRHEPPGLSVMPPDADVKVYVYELPPELNMGVRTDWDCLCCETGLAAVEMRIHRALLNSSRFRTLDPEQADFFYVPFYTECAWIPVEALWKSGDTSLQPELDEKVRGFRGLFSSAMRILREDYPFYNRTAGRDHIFTLPLGHGPQRITNWRWHIRDSIFLTAAAASYTPRQDQWEYSQTWKDVVIPLFHNHPDGIGRERRQNRTNLAFFWGHPDNYPRRHPNDTKVRMTRHELVAAMANATDVLVGATPKLDIPEVANGTISRRAVGSAALSAKQVHWQQMLDSVFCLAPEGWHPNSGRPFEALAAGCIPVILADEFELPFQDFLDWRAFSIKIPQARTKDVLSILRNISQENIEAKRDAMDAHWRAFQYPEPSAPDDAFHYIMAALARKKRRMKDSYLNYWT